MERTQRRNESIVWPGQPGALDQVVEGVREIWSRRLLTRYLIQAELTKKGSDTLLGNVWWVLDPLLQMVVYVVLVAVIFQRSIEAYPLFIFAAILPWKWFTSSINDAITSVTARDRIIKQVKFPKLVLPVAAVTGGIVNFAFGLIPLLGLMVLFYPQHLSPALLLLPAVALVQFVFTLPLAIVLGAVNVFYRDIGNVVRHGLRLWFYLSPGLYGADQLAHLTDQHRVLAWFFAANPFTTLFESYRNVVYAGAPPLWGGLFVWLVLSIVLCGVAIVFFKRLEPAFAKVL
ncbi:MAG TPA: ABC transporter permease [Candidatus Binatia bacterium]|nr:ABC transporter permease [Candidatus Binatia bacterium]